MSNHQAATPFPRLGPPGIEIQRYQPGGVMRAGLSDMLHLHGQTQVTYALQNRFDRLIQTYGIR
jgi:hypothetical protein